MSDDPKTVLAAVDALVDRGRERDRLATVRTRAAALGADPDVAVALASTEDQRPPARLGGKAPGVFLGQQNPVVRQRVERIRAAMDEGRLTPREGLVVLEAMNADEAQATALLDAMPTGRVPLEAKAQVWGPDEPGPPLPPGGMLPEGWSLLSRSQRAELAARRAMADA